MSGATALGLVAAACTMTAFAPQVTVTSAVTLVLLVPGLAQILILPHRRPAR